MTEPVTELDARYGEPTAEPIPWAEVSAALTAAELFWVSTVRPDGRPYVTPLLALWRDGALHFCTGADERKARNIASNPEVVLTTGTNARHGGTDLVVEGRAERVTGPGALKALAGAWEDKYGAEWHFDVLDGGFDGGNGLALVFRVEPSTAFGFGKGPYSQTAYRFPTG